MQKTVMYWIIVTCGGGNFVRGGYPPRKTAKCRWEMSKETLKERLEDSFCRWDKELLSGGSDPYYTDGKI